MSRRKNDDPDEQKVKSISFNIEGRVAKLFEEVRAKATNIPEFWAHSRLTKADFARHLLMKSLVEMAKDLRMDLEEASNG